MATVVVKAHQHRLHLLHLNLVSESPTFVRTTPDKDEEEESRWYWGDSVRIVTLCSGGVHLKLTN